MATTRAASVSVALVGLAVSLPLGVAQAAGDPAVGVRSCEAFPRRERTVQRIGHSLTDAARQFCGQQTMPAAPLSRPACIAPPAGPRVIEAPPAAAPAPVHAVALAALSHLPPPADF